MKAEEAGKIADIIVNAKHKGLWCYKVAGQWYDWDDDKRDLKGLIGEYVPLVPMKQYKVGDVVSFAEALQSGMCFQTDNGETYKADEIGCHKYTCNNWVRTVRSADYLVRQQFTIVHDPSVKPKPTIESLPVGTIFRAEWFTSPKECVKGWDKFYPKGGCTGVQFGEIGWVLTHIKNDNGEWEEIR